MACNSCKDRVETASPSPIPKEVAHGNQSQGAQRPRHTRHIEKPADDSRLAWIADFAHNGSMEYQIEIEAFKGPMDLLLYLVRRDEVDILDIPIARIAGQFLEYLDVIQAIDVEWAGDFLVMSATLMEIKSRMLLPRPEEMNAEEADPRRELVKQLLEYKKYKDAASLLEEQAERQQSRMSRLPLEMPPPPDPAQQPLHQVELWDLVSAFGRLMRETASLTPRQIVVDETPLHVHMEQIETRLQECQRLPFRDLFMPPHSRGRLIGLFLAILELVRRGRILAEQAEPLGEIWVGTVPPSVA
ncbi:MAG: chromosome segregation protein ScpA [Planctomycetes bacterium]|nr:chromosome segregation protein ScpA [Planctomycetota bacterium]